MKVIKQVMVKTCDEDGRFEATAVYRGEQALVVALAEHYEIVDVEKLAAGLTAVIVDLQVEQMWREWALQGGGDGSEAEV
jgi:hypothetical protein